MLAEVVPADRGASPATGEMGTGREYRQVGLFKHLMIHTFLLPLEQLSK